MFPSQKAYLDSIAAQISPTDTGALGIITQPSDTVCAGELVNFSLTLATDTSDDAPTLFYWMVPAGWQILAGQWTPAITVLPTTANVGRVTVFDIDFYLNQCSCTYASRLAVSKTCCPAFESGPISGDSSFSLQYYASPHMTEDSSFTNGAPASHLFCGRDSTKTFSIAPVPGVSDYEWLPPIGANIVSGQGTTSCEVCFDSTVFWVGFPSTISVIVRKGCYAAISNFHFMTDSKIFPLPINLISFTAKRNGMPVNLSWSTASERDNKEFIIERSFNGKTFNPIGRVTGAGNTTRTNYYSFTDQNALAGVSYYRLKQVDLSGKYDYSPVRSVRAVNPIAGAVLHAYPNPTNGELLLDYPKEDSQATIRVQSITGQLVWEGSAAQLQGSGNQLSLESFEAGAYLVTYTSAQRTLSIRVNKL